MINEVLEKVKARAILASAKANIFMIILTLLLIRRNIEYNILITRYLSNIVAI